MASKNKSRPDGSVDSGVSRGVDQSLGGEGAAGLWGSKMSPEQFVQKLPGWPDQLPKNEAGVRLYFQQAQADPALVQQWTETAKTDPEAALDAAAVWASSEGKFKDAAGVERRAGDEGSKPAGKPKGKKQKPFQPMGADQLSALVRGLMENAPAGGLPGGTLKGVEFKQTRDGVEIRINNRGSELERQQQLAGPGAAPANEPPPGRRGRKAKEDKPEPRQPMSMREQIDQAKQRYVDRTGMPAPWYTGAVERVKRYGPGVAAGVGATAVGVPAAVLLGAGAVSAGKAAYDYITDDGEEDKRRPQQGTPTDSGGLREMFVPQAKPAQGAPQQQIPAGTPAPNNTTLLERMMRSREYA